MDDLEVAMYAVYNELNQVQKKKIEAIEKATDLMRQGLVIQELAEMGKTHSLENYYKGLEKAMEIMKKQFEKGGEE